MTYYRARAWREDPWWVIEVEGVGATQAKTVDKIDHMARALVADVEGVPYDEVGITVHIDLPDAVAKDVRTMKEASARAADLTREAARLQREVVQKLHVNEHLTGREIAAVLGVTPGRVSQLFKASPTKSRSQATLQPGSARTRASGST
jgi:DNA-directed RNA polymerase specialized sigma subunit